MNMYGVHFCLKNQFAIHEKIWEIYLDTDTDWPVLIILYSPAIHMQCIIINKL